jgi:hypothetical protein
MFVLSCEIYVLLIDSNFWIRFRAFDFLKQVVLLKHGPSKEILKITEN